ncbi:MAG: hypothetical protein ABSH16_12770 [Sedimentisphaerales bacterium]
MTINVRKILATVIFTLLIWVWADLALDEQLTVSNTLDKVVLKGSARRIADIRQRINEGRFGREFYFDPEHEKMTAPGDHLLNLAEFLKETDRISQLGITVVSVEPNTVTVSVVELQKKTVPVRCFDDNQNPLKTAGIVPSQVEAFVPAEREGSALEAKVVLSRREMEQARLATVEKMPYIELAPGQNREVGTSVKITLPKEQERLQEYLITNVRMGFSLSANLEGKYKVELVNPDAVMGTVAIRATPEAKRAYDNMRYQVILEIDDSDRDKGSEEIRRDLIYNFPPEFVRRDEILLNQAPVQARFRLVPITPAVVEPAPAPAQN